VVKIISHQPKEATTMFSYIVGNIICSEFEHTFGGSRPDAKTNSEIHRAMQVRFSLNPDYTKEDGYRHLTVLLYGGGSNYIAVYGKLDWNVIPVEYDGKTKEYTEGNTDWVLLGYHDSCWRSAVTDLLWKYRERIATIDSLFNGPTGWYKTINLTEEERKRLHEIRTDRDKSFSTLNHKQVKLEDLEFQF
jgi:hypothetical protein